MDKHNFMQLRPLVAEFKSNETLTLVDVSIQYAADTLSVHQVHQEPIKSGGHTLINLEGGL